MTPLILLKNCGSLVFSVSRAGNWNQVVWPKYHIVILKKFFKGGLNVWEGSDTSAAKIED